MVAFYRARDFPLPIFTPGHVGPLVRPPLELVHAQRWGADFNSPPSARPLGSRRLPSKRIRAAPPTEPAFDPAFGEKARAWGFGDAGRLRAARAPSCTAAHVSMPCCDRLGSG